ncbi:hypothetical protein [Massilia sp. 9I]|uniref:hypothetical protein n=1 Tax=Massilia sp. 9I TaxID=2653152 RepID=UPI0012F10C5B|nr:hypothetical protein [Massilia sp. 9I]VXC65620.1 conserved hypothetical protein [Massilia sp. 9I]
MHTNAQPTKGPIPFDVDPDERRQIARYHAALFPTRLALSRWQHGGHIPHLHHGAPAVRAAWYAAARRDFQAWLDRGGFMQHEDAPLPLRPPEITDCQPARDGDTQHLGTCT